MIALFTGGPGLGNKRTGEEEKKRMKHENWQERGKAA